jgi:hypothetical protein
MRKVTNDRPLIDATKSMRLKRKLFSVGAKFKDDRSPGGIHRNGVLTFENVLRGSEASFMWRKRLTLEGMKSGGQASSTRIRQAA